MEFLLYLLSNFCVMVAMFVVALKLGTAYAKGRAAARAELQALNISPDTLILLCIGAVARCYWSFSPPGVWAHESSMIQGLGMLDVICSLFVHIGLVALIFVIQFADAAFSTKNPDIVGLFMNFLQGEGRGGAPTPIYAQALPLAVVTFAVAGLSAYFGLDAFESPGAFPLTDTFIVFNMMVDMVAMIPQILSLANGAVMGDSRKTTQATTHFVALLSVARVFRLMFWLALWFMWGEAVWVFILPDVLHTVLMGDFLYQWVMAVRRDAAMIL